MAGGGGKERSELGKPPLSPSSTTHAPEGPGGVLGGRVSQPRASGVQQLPPQGHLTFHQRQTTWRPALPAGGGRR